MKYFTAFFLTISLSYLGLTVSGQAKSDSLTDVEVNNMICQKWKLAYVESGEKKSEIPEGEETIITFKIDGTFIEQSKRFNSTQGKWIYDRKSRLFETDEKGGKEKSKLIKLTENELILQFEYPKGILRAIYMKVTE